MAVLFRPPARWSTRSLRLTAAALLLASVAGCGTATRAAGPTSTSPAAASDSPTSPLTDSASPSADAGQAAPCQAANLTVDPVTGNPMGMTQTIYRVRLVNHGPACTLSGYPQNLTGLALTGTTQQVHTHPATADDITSQTSGKPADLATGDAAEFVLHTALGCEDGGTGPSKTETYTRLWFTLPGQPGPITVLPGKPVDVGPGVIALASCNTAVTRFYAALPATTPSASPTPADGSDGVTPDPTGILDDPQPPAGANDFISGNRWHGTVGGRDVNVYAGAVLGESGSPRDGLVVVEFNQPGTADIQTIYLHAAGSGPLMLVAAHGDRLILWDTNGYQHTLLLADVNARLSGPEGGPVAIPADSLFPVAGSCGWAHKQMHVSLGGDGVPDPRCAWVFPDTDSLTVSNATAGAGQPGWSFTVRFPSLPQVALAPGQSHTFDHPFTGLAPGIHFLHLGPNSSPAIWVR